jgi:hypothetical protein
MRRYVCTIPLTLLVVATAGWVRTNWCDEYLHWQQSNAPAHWWDVISIGSESGKLIVGRSRSVVPYSFTDGFNYRRYAQATRTWDDREPAHAFLGFEYQPHDFSHDTGWLAVPYWFISAILAQMALVAWLWPYQSSQRGGGFPVKQSR